jgi:hypothetical protein
MTTAPVRRGGIGGWVIAGIVAILLAALAGYFVLAGGAVRYNAPATPVPATGAPATGAPATAPGVPAPQVTAPPAPRYP